MALILQRRRFLALMALGVGVPLTAHLTRHHVQLALWEGVALGAPATIRLYHQHEGHAQAAIHAALGELARLESIFSLQRSDSALSRLNRDAVLHDAPPDLVRLLQRALQLAQLSDGVYDPTVQPLWNLYQHHFSQPNADPAGPSSGAREAALRLVNWRAVHLDPAQGRITLEQSGMGVTLNGGAQGYITDRVAEVLRAHGFDRMLVDMGEPLALSHKPDGSAWRLALANPANTSEAIATIEVVDRCVATSGGYGTLFDSAGRFTHIFDTRTGLTAPALLGVSVIARSGMIADGLSTALLMVPEQKRLALLRAAGGEQAIFVTPQGISAHLMA